MTSRLSPNELELLELLVDADRKTPSELFVAVFSSGGTDLRHMTRPQRSLGAPSIPALMALADAGLLRVERYDKNRPGAFYLASHASAELESAKRATAEKAAADAQRAAAERAGGREPLSLAHALERMIALQQAHPGGFFTPYDTRPHPSIGYSGVQGQHLSLAHGEFARLLTCGALVKQEQHPGVYYLMPQAGDVLAAEQRLQSDSPLATAERRAAMANRRREATARVAGWVAGAGVVLLILYLVLNREELFPPGQIAGAVYEVVTVVLGVTGLAVAALVSRLVRRAVRVLLRWWLDPEAPAT